MRCSYPNCPRKAVGVAYGPLGWSGVCPEHAELADNADREVVRLAPHQLAHLHTLQVLPQQLVGVVSEETLQYMLAASVATPVAAVGKPIDDYREPQRPWRP